MVACNKCPVSYTLRDLHFSAHRSLFFANALLRSPFCVNSLALLICELTLQPCLPSHTELLVLCKKAAEQLSPKPLFFHCGWHKVSTRGNSAKLLHPTEEIKSSAEATLMCQAEERKPEGHGIPESSRQGTIMIWWIPSLNFQTNCCDSKQVWASWGRWLGERKEGSSTKRSGIEGCIAWPGATGVLYSHIKWAGQLWVTGTATCSMWFSGYFVRVLPAAADEDIQRYCGKSTCTLHKSFSQAEEQCLFL